MHPGYYFTITKVLLNDFRQLKKNQWNDQNLVSGEVANTGPCREHCHIDIYHLV